MKRSIRVLIIEDNEDDTLLEIDELKRGGFNIDFERIETPEAMMEAMASKPWDCIISDFSMPRFSGLDALTTYKESGKDIPFILISGTIGEEIAVQAMKAGAHDYIMKNNLTRLVPALERELREAEFRRQKRNAEEAARYERVLLRTLINHLPDPVYIKDDKGRKILANKADLDFLGYSTEAEVRGKTDQETLLNESGRNSYEDDLEILQTGCPVINREEEVMDTEGKPHWLLTTKIPIYNEKGEVSGLVGLRHDITGRKQYEIALSESESNLKKQNHEYEVLNMEYLALNEELTESLNHIQKMNAELIRAKDKAEESDNLKSAFLANMSHEIRTPLNAIMGFSSFLKDPELSIGRTNEFVDIIESSGQQLLTIISDILDISKIEAGLINITPETVNINAVFNSLYQQFKKQAEAKNLDLILHIPHPEKTIMVTTDENRLRQVMCNLMNNAIKFTSTGYIQFGYLIKGKSISFFVKDTGIGISAEDQSIVFIPFRQVETTSSRTYGGNGLGLSISRALVNKLGGTLSLVSEEGKGSVFSFNIPYVKGNDNDTDAEPLIQSDIQYNWDKHKILIAEDELFNYRYIKEILLPTNVKTLHAWDGKQAVEMVREHPDISLVLMDLKMPEMDGYAATRIIKKLRPHLPVIAQTATALSEDREYALKSGFDNWLSKPIERNMIKEIIDPYLV
jgi:PAS domain S-box-containing protein